MIHRLILDSIEEDLLAVPQNLNDICIFTEDAEFDTRPRTDINYCLNWFPLEAMVTRQRNNKLDMNTRAVFM